MDKLLLNNFVIVYLFSEFVTLLIAISALFKGAVLIKNWNFNSFSQKQIKLENQSYLLSVQAVFLFLFKLILLIYFVYMIDSLSVIVPGAMCAAGVISANSYGMVLLFVKLITIFLLLFFTILNKLDIEAKYYPYMKLKTYILIFAALLVFLESYLDAAYIFNIDISRPVSCCSALFGNLEGANPLPFNLNIKNLLILFYTLFIAYILSLLLENKTAAFIVLTFFAAIAYYAVVYFFGTYVYELPTHKCPFCMMQKEYFYTGYLIWGLLIFGAYFGYIWIFLTLLKQNFNKLKNLSLLLISLFVSICTLYVLVYYFKNGTFL